MIQMSFITTPHYNAVMKFSDKHCHYNEVRLYISEEEKLICL